MADSIDLSGRIALITGASGELRAQMDGEGGDAHVMALNVTDGPSIISADDGFGA